MNARPNVLYVEDEESDRFLMKLAFEKEGIEGAVRFVEDGQAAIDYLAGAGPYGARDTFPLPSVVLLDLNLPAIHGFDVLRWIRGNPKHAALPVVVFSSSVREEDQSRAMQLGANAFLTKPSSPSLFRDVVRQLTHHWLKPVFDSKDS